MSWRRPSSIAAFQECTALQFGAGMTRLCVCVRARDCQYVYWIQHDFDFDAESAGFKTQISNCRPPNPAKPSLTLDPVSAESCQHFQLQQHTYYVCFQRSSRG
jgi:hypothetical protein